MTNGSELTHQEKTSAQREPEHVIDGLMQHVTLATKAGEPGVPQIHRAPGRCVVQGEGAAVSVSWFGPRLSESSPGELQIIVWTGVVTLPGGGTRDGRRAEVSAVHPFHLVRAHDTGWRWQDGTGDASTYSSADLVQMCLELLRTVESGLSA